MTYLLRVVGLRSLRRPGNLSVGHVDDVARFDILRHGLGLVRRVLARQPHVELLLVRARVALDGRRQHLGAFDQAVGAGDAQEAEADVLAGKVLERSCQHDEAGSAARVMVN